MDVTIPLSCCRAEPKNDLPRHGIIHRLTGPAISRLHPSTVNLDPLSVRKEINKEEKEHDRIAGDYYASEKKLSLLTVNGQEARRKSPRLIARGHTIPFKCCLPSAPGTKSKQGLIAKNDGD